MYHVDTQLGSNDYAPFVVGGVPVINNTSYPRDGAMPGSIGIFDDINNPFIFGIITLDTVNPPDILNLAQYNTAGLSLSYDNLPAGRVGDSGYAVIWENRTAPASGSSQTFTTYYGVQNPPLDDFDLTALVPIQKIIGYTEAFLGTDGQGLGVGFTNNNGGGLTLQIGAYNAVEQRMTVSIGAMDSDAIGIGNFDVTTAETAQTAMENVKKAITAVSEQRASLGAMQNRLEHTVNSLTVTGENLAASEAQIRDADIAAEILNYTKYNILQQAAQAMLAQANQEPQAVLQLLQ
jgi:flagellin